MQRNWTSSTASCAIMAFTVQYTVLQKFSDKKNMYRAKWFRDFISKQRLVSAIFQKIIQKVSQTGIHLKSLAPISGFTRLLASQNGFVVNWVNCIVIQRCVCNTIALNCLVFWENRVFCILATEKRTNRQTNRQTDEQMDSIDALSRSRCSERRLKNIDLVGKMQ